MGPYSLSWDFRYYFRKKYCEQHGLAFKSKYDLAIEMIENYPTSDDELVYVLMDSWYTSEKLVKDCNAKGFHVIVAVKSNKICLAGIRISFSDFASQYSESLFFASLPWRIRGKY